MRDIACQGLPAADLIIRDKPLNTGLGKAILLIGDRRTSLLCNKANSDQRFAGPGGIAPGVFHVCGAVPGSDAPDGILAAIGKGLVVSSTKLRFEAYSTRKRSFGREAVGKYALSRPPHIHIRYERVEGLFGRQRNALF